jgi:predicted Zn-dependent protease with MMP-like domain
MHKLLALLLAHVPSDFRILFRQFLLRVVDFDALSIQADVAGYLGQFAGVLMMLSLIVRPAKAGMSSRGRTCRGKSQKPRS